MVGLLLIPLLQSLSPRGLGFIRPRTCSGLRGIARLGRCIWKLIPCVETPEHQIRNLAIFGCGLEPAMLIMMMTVVSIG